MAYSQQVSIEEDLPSERSEKRSASITPELDLYDVIIVGAGISGLYAARCFQEEGLNVLILEATERVGGRILSYKDTRYGMVDLGGARVGRLQSKVLSLVRELGLELYRHPSNGKDVFFHKDKRLRHTPDSSPVSNPLVTMDITHCLRSIDKMSKQVPIETPWTCSKAEEWDHQTVLQFLQKICWFEQSRVYLEAQFSAILCSKLEEISFLHFLHTVRSWGGCGSILSQNNNVQEMNVKGGAAQLCDRLAEKLNEIILLNTSVTGIHQGHQGVVVKTASEKEYKCQRVVFATSPTVLRHISFTPVLPDDIQTVVDSRIQAKGLKSILFYDKPFWRQQGCTGRIVTEEGLISMSMDSSGAEEGTYALSGMVDAVAYGGLTREDRKLQLAGHLSSIVESPEMRLCSGYMEKDWAGFESLQFYGCPYFLLPPGVITKTKRLWGTPHQRIHFAGTDAALGFRGCIEGALRAGESVTREVIGAMKLPEKRCYETDSGHISFGKKSARQILLPSVPQFLGLLAFFVLLLIILIIIIAILSSKGNGQEDTPSIVSANLVTSSPQDMTSVILSTLIDDLTNLTTALPLNMTTDTV